jgi:hypothetical protein
MRRRSASNRVAYEDSTAGKIGELRKLVVHDGHGGPAEIGVQPEFFAMVDGSDAKRSRRYATLDVTAQT